MNEASVYDDGYNRKKGKKRKKKLISDREKPKTRKPSLKFRDNSECSTTTADSEIGLLVKKELPIASAYDFEDSEVSNKEIKVKIKPEKGKPGRKKKKHLKDKEKHAAKGAKNIEAKKNKKQKQNNKSKRKFLNNEIFNPNEPLDVSDADVQRKLMAMPSLTVFKPTFSTKELSNTQINCNTSPENNIENEPEMVSVKDLNDPPSIISTVEDYTENDIEKIEETSDEQYATIVQIHDEIKSDMEIKRCKLKIIKQPNVLIQRKRIKNLQNANQSTNINLDDSKQLSYSALKSVNTTLTTKQSTSYNKTTILKAPKLNLPSPKQDNQQMPKLESEESIQGKNLNRLIDTAYILPPKVWNPTQSLHLIASSSVTYLPSSTTITKCGRPIQSSTSNQTTPVNHIQSQQSVQRAEMHKQSVLLQRNVPLSQQNRSFHTDKMLAAEPVPINYSKSAGADPSNIIRKFVQLPDPEKFFASALNPENKFEHSIPLLSNNKDKVVSSSADLTPPIKIPKPLMTVATITPTNVPKYPLGNDYLKSKKISSTGNYMFAQKKPRPSLLRISAKPIQKNLNKTMLPARQFMPTQNFIRNANNSLEEEDDDVIIEEVAPKLTPPDKCSLLVSKKCSIATQVNNLPGSENGIYRFNTTNNNNLIKQPIVNLVDVSTRPLSLGTQNNEQNCTPRSAEVALNDLPETEKIFMESLPQSMQNKIQNKAPSILNSMESKSRRKSKEKPKKIVVNRVSDATVESPSSMFQSCLLSPHSKSALPINNSTIPGHISEMLYPNVPDSTCLQAFNDYWSAQISHCAICAPFALAKNSSNRQMSPDWKYSKPTVLPESSPIWVRIIFSNK